MKISKLFHWLYALVMFLPILSIPIFAIYSHRHTLDSYSVVVEEKEVINFNQLVTFDDYITENGGLTFNFSSDGSLTINGTNQDSVATFVNFTLINEFDIGCYKPINNDVVLYNGFSDSSRQIRSCYLLVNPGTYTNYVLFPQLFDLTVMFGAGNEPSNADFLAMFPNEYYSYTLGTPMLINTGNNITYNDSDIGSQFLYVSYNYVDKYFNYDNVFNFGSLYSWLEVTFFNGNATLGFFIFWHLLVYWLLTSLIWLIFDVLMYVPQLVHRWLDKASLS